MHDHPVFAWVTPFFSTKSHVLMVSFSLKLYHLIRTLQTEHLKGINPKSLDNSQNPTRYRRQFLVPTVSSVEIPPVLSFPPVWQRIGLVVRMVIRRQAVDNKDWLIIDNWATVVSTYLNQPKATNHTLLRWSYFKTT